MNTFKDMLKYLREREGLSQQELAQKLGVSKSTISMYEVGNRQPNFEMEEMIADLFNVSLEFLRGKPSYMTSSNSMIPIYDTILHNQTGLIYEDMVGTFPISNKLSNISNLFGYRMRDCSMEPLINRNDLLIVETKAEIKNENFVLFLLDNRNILCKQFYLYETGICLTSQHPQYPPLFFSKDSMSNNKLQIIGKVIALHRDLSSYPL